jgi:hypothetical protein
MTNENPPLNTADEAIGLPASELLDICDDPPSLTIARPAPAALRILGLSGGELVHVIEGEGDNALQTVREYEDGTRPVPYDVPRCFVIDTPPTRVFIKLTKPQAEVTVDPICSPGAPIVARVDADAHAKAVFQSLGIGAAQQQVIKDNAGRLALEDETSSGEEQPISPETQEAGIQQPIWLGDRYADADGDRTLPRLQLVEERPSSDHRPFFISAERSQLEREMVAKAAREATSRSAIDPNYHPYRATEI